MRENLGLHEPLWGSVLVESRAMNAMVHLPGEPSILIFSVYMYDGEGLSIRNREILGTLGAAVKMSGLQAILGGDWNFLRKKCWSRGFLRSWKAL